MHAYLITGVDDELIIKRAEKLAKTYKAKLVEFPLSKIEDARVLSKFLKLGPSQKLAILLKNVENATTETLNATLKNLEERENFIFILTAVSKYKVLPTIVSRCTVISVGGEVDEKTGLEAREFINADTPKRLKIIESYKGRADAQAFVQNLLIYGEGELKNGDMNLGPVLSAGLLVKKKLQANTNPFLQLTNFVISLDD